MSMPMSCREADLAQAAMDAGEFELSQRTRVREHLDWCADCAVRVRGLSHLSRLIRDSDTKLTQSQKSNLWHKIAAETTVEAQPISESPSERLVPRQIDFDPLSRRNCALWQDAVTKAYRRHVGPRQRGQRMQEQESGGQNPSVGALVATCKRFYRRQLQRYHRQLQQLRRLPATWKLAGLALPMFAVIALLLVIGVEQHPRGARVSVASGRAVDLALQHEWRLVAANRLTINGFPRPAGTAVEFGDRVAIGAGGRALIITAAEAILVNERTSFKVHRAATHPEIDLYRGFVQVSTRRHPHLPSKTTVDCGGFKLRPIGTSYAVRRDGVAELAVVDGQVQVSSNRGQTSVRAGFSWTADDKTRRLPQSRRAALQRERRQALRIARRSRAKTSSVVRLVGRPNSTITIDGLRLGVLQATIELEGGAHQVGLASLARDSGPPDPQRTINVEPGSEKLVDVAALMAARPSSRPMRIAAIGTPTTVTAGRSSASAGGSRRVPWTVDSGLQRRLDRIQKLLALGNAAGARRAAHQLLSATDKSSYGATLQTIIAESYMIEHNFTAAARMYLLVHRRHPGTAQGGHGLFMAASLALERLGRVEASERHFATYLRRYPRGIHKHDAYFMRCIALLALDEPYRARALARTYVAKHPRGRYAKQLRKIVASARPLSRRFWTGTPIK